MGSGRRAAPLALAAFAALALGRGTSPRALADEKATCPSCGAGFSYGTLASWNQGGGIDTDGCRFAVGTGGRLYVPELHELVACTSSRCQAAFFRAHLDPARHLARVPVLDAPAVRDLGDAATLAPASVTVARAIATYAAYGQKPFGIADDPQAFEGKLWLRAAWAVREAAVSEDDVARLPYLFAPRSPELANLELSNFERQFQARLSAAATPVDAALAGLDDAREALAPLEPHDPDTPSRALLYGRAVASIDEVERTLLDLRTGLREKSEAGGDMPPRELALALARAALREGSAPVRDRWIERATIGRDVPEAVREAADRLRSLARAESRLLVRALGCLAPAADHASGERRRELLVLAADSARRSGDVARARALVETALAGSKGGIATERATTLRYAMGEAR